MNNFKDYNVYIFKLKMKEKVAFIIDMGIFLFATITLVQSWTTMAGQGEVSIANMMIVGLSIVKLIWDCVAVWQRIESQEILKTGILRGEGIAIEAIQPSEMEEKNGFRSQACGNKVESEKEECTDCPKKKDIDYVMHSPEIDQFLRGDQQGADSNQLVIKKDKAMEVKIKRIIKQNQDRLLPFLTWQYRISKFYGKQFFNEEKLCLSRDIDPKSNVVHCHKGTYYDTFLTNQICGKSLQSTKDDSIIVDATNDFPIDEKGNVLRLSEVTKAEMNNEIGISTIGITKDNYIIFWKQNAQAQSSTGLLVPTGSGSCDWKDLVRGKSEENNKDEKSTWDFRETITGAMQRELWEESMANTKCKDYRKVGKTRVIGFFRWTIKGGKPEFVGVTKINMDFNEIQSNSEEVYKGVEKKIETKEELLKFIEEMLQKKLSTPLYMNLISLRDYIENGTDKEEIENFLITK